jgi:hypothetical protein
VCALLVTKHYPDAHVLVCTQSNSAADLYVKYIDAELKGTLTLLLYPYNVMYVSNTLVHCNYFLILDTDDLVNFELSKW